MEDWAAYLAQVLPATARTDPEADSRRGVLDMAIVRLEGRWKHHPVETAMATAPTPDARMDRWYAAPQTLVKVSRRRRLNLLITGEGTPTVIFAPGGGGTSLDWSRVQHPIATKTRTVTYDPAGWGFSDPGPPPRTAAAAVTDLRKALAVAEIRPPYVLVGWSRGGLHMKLFAFSYPEDVVGMVLVDPATEHQYPRIFEATGERRLAPTLREQREQRRRILRVERMARAGALLPGTPEYDEFVGQDVPTLTPAVNAARVAQRTSPGRYRTMRSESANLTTATSAEVAAARRSLGDMPLIVLTSSRRPGFLEEQAAAALQEVVCTMHGEVAALSKRGERRTIDAGHSIQFEKPGAVIAAIDEVLALTGGSQR